MLTKRFCQKIQIFDWMFGYNAIYLSFIKKIKYYEKDSLVVYIFFSNHLHIF